MKKRAAHLGLINWTITLLTAAYFLWHAIPKPASNFYVTAQLATVLVDTDDGYGSGVAIVRTDPTGVRRVFVWTARHVIRGGKTFSIKLFTRVNHRKVGGMEFTARVLAELEYADAALLLTDAPAELFPAMQFDTEDTAELGDAVFSIGNPKGSIHDGALSEGIVSQFGIEFGPIDNLNWPVVDQTTAALNPGCSGGPIFSTSSHKIIGMGVGSGGNGINIFVPTRALLIACRSADLEWALKGDACPGAAELNNLRPHPDTWLKKLHSLFGQGN